MNPRPSLRLLSLPFLAVAVVLASGCSSQIAQGETYSNAAAFSQRVEDTGYVIIGQFNDQWPATVVSTSTGDGSISVNIPGQGTHEYSGLDGYAMQAVVLKHSGNQHSGFVLRSKEKK